MVRVSLWHTEVAFAAVMASMPALQMAEMLTGLVMRSMVDDTMVVEAVEAVVVVVKMHSGLSLPNAVLHNRSRSFSNFLPIKWNIF